MERGDIPPNIAAAIRRAEEARGALRARRRRTAAAIAALSLAAGVPVSLSFTDFGATDMVQAAATRVQSLVELLNQRSPGQRTAAQLTKTKHKPMALARQRPAARHYPPVPPIAFAPTPMAVELASIVMPAPPFIPPTLGQVDIGPPPTLGAIISPPGGGGVIIPPGGDTPASNPTPQPREPVIVTPPVPEPATWAMMLLGFGLIGWRIRRGQAVRRQPLTV